MRIVDVCIECVKHEEPECPLNIHPVRWRAMLAIARKVVDEIEARENEFDVIEVGGELEFY